MFHLLALLESIQARVRPPVVVIMGSPAQAADLCAGLRHVEAVCYQMDVYQADKLRQQLAELGLPATVETQPDLWDLPGRRSLRARRQSACACLPAVGPRKHGAQDLRPVRPATGVARVRS